MECPYFFSSKWETSLRRMLLAISSDLTSYVPCSTCSLICLTFSARSSSPLLASSATRCILRASGEISTLAEAPLSLTFESASAPAGLTVLSLLINLERSASAGPRCVIFMVFSFTLRLSAACRVFLIDPKPIGSLSDYALFCTCFLLGHRSQLRSFCDTAQQRLRFDRFTR